MIYEFITRHIIDNRVINKKLRVNFHQKVAYVIPVIDIRALVLLELVDEI